MLAEVLPKGGCSTFLNTGYDEIEMTELQRVISVWCKVGLHCH